MRISFGSVEMEENHLSDQHIEPLSGYSSFDFGTSFIFNDSFTEPSFYSFSEPPLARVDVVEGNNYVANDLADFFAFDDNATDMTMSNLSNEFELDVGSTYRVSAVDEEPQIHKRLLESVAPLIDCVDVDSVDLMNTTSECEASQSGTSSTDDAVTIHQYGWTPEDNYRLDRLVSGELQKVAMKAKDLKWATITAMFNEKYKQNRSKVQVYSHWRNYTVLKKNRVFSAAEEEAVRALDEIKMPLEHVARLMGKRSVNQIEVKLAKMLSGESAPVVDPEEAKRRAKFRERVKSVVLDSGWLMAEDTVSQELVERMNTLVTIDPNLLKNSHPIGVGRPKKPKTVDDDAFSRSIYGELAMMLRPFSYVNNRRKRTTCLPGDGRRYGLNLFAVSRLLGSPFDIERLPKETDDALSMGVKEVDLQSFVVMRDLMAKNHNKAMHDRLGYNQIPDTSPIVSLLPPMLFTVTGIRSVLLYRDTLRYVVENEDGEQAAKVEECSSRAHDLVSEADDKLVQMLDSFFFFPWSLLTVNGDGNDNSDVETDSDEDQVWCEKDETLEEDCWY